MKSSLFFFVVLINSIEWLFSPRYQLEDYPNPSSRNSGVNLIRQQSYISAVRSANQSEQPDFGKISEWLKFWFNFDLK